MSARTALATLRGCLQDEAVGIKHAIEQLAATTEAPSSGIITSLRFVSWVLTDALQPATTANVMIRPRTWTTDQKRANQRDGRCQFEVAYQTFAADPEVIEANVSLAATALMQSLDALREYSDAKAGPIIDLDGDEPVLFRFGEFDKAPASHATTSGFIATVTLTERSAE